MLVIIIGLSKRMSNFLQPYQVETLQSFYSKLMDWFNANGRHDLPWKPSHDVSEAVNIYRIWLSEIMLQQTQVVTVIPYFLRFTQRFPTVESLAQSELSEVLKLWEGLGYYARARNLHNASQQIVSHFNGKIPCQFQEIQTLKGIGRTTAAAILAQGYNRPFAIFDGNVKRVMARILGATCQEKALEKVLLPFTYLLSLQNRPNDYTQAIMDFGASICKKKPRCDECFWQTNCITYTESQVDDIPAKKIRKVRPVKSTYFLIIKNQKQEILFQHRKEEKIWNNLYSFPEWDNDLSLFIEILEQKDDLSIKSISQLPMFKHQFTHFTLEITPIMIEIDSKTNVIFIEKSFFEFLPLSEIDKLPKSKPSNTILNKYINI